MPSPEKVRFHLLAIAAVATPALTLEPVVHEVLGHAVTAWFTGARVVAISSTQVATQGGGRLIPANGPLANLVVGMLSYFVLRRILRFSQIRLFLWLFTFANLFLGTGYIAFSGVTNFGDSIAVIAGLNPAWLYRGALIVFGACGYAISMELAARDMHSLIRAGALSAENVSRICYVSCAAGTLLYIAAATLHSNGTSLMLGVAMACGVSGGLLALPSILQGRAVASAQHSSNSSSLPLSAGWLAIASIAAILFLFFLGRGIRLG